RQPARGRENDERRTMTDGPRTPNRERALSAEALGVPAMFNAAAHFVDRHVAQGRASHVAIECGDARITYGQVQEHVNRCGHALRGAGVRPEDRVLLLLLDGPE